MSALDRLSQAPWEGLVGLAVYYCLAIFTLLYFSSRDELLESWLGDLT